MNKALPIILAILISAAAFGGVGYYLGTQKADKSTTTATATVTTTASGTATADVTANWKTYTNDTYGFSFKYPSGWTISDQLQEKGEESAVNKDYLKISKGDASITMYFEPAGWGSPQPEITYKVSIKDNKMVLSDKAVLAPSEQNEIAQEPGLITLVSQDRNSFALTLGGYNMAVSATNVGLSQEATIVSILSTFQFTK